jgi:hypothetical protein
MLCPSKKSADSKLSKRAALVTVATFAALACSVAGCASAPPPCRKSPSDDVVVGARTGAEAAKTGARTGVEGVKTAGKAVGGLFSGGPDEAKAKWNEGKQATKEEAKEGASQVDEEANVPRCEK